MGWETAPTVLFLSPRLTHSGQARLNGSEPLLAIPASCDGDMNTFFFTTLERWRIERLIAHHAMAVIRSAVLPPSGTGRGNGG